MTRRERALVAREQRRADLEARGVAPEQIRRTLREEFSFLPE